MTELLHCIWESSICRQCTNERRRRRRGGVKETGSGVALAGTLPAAHRFLGEVGWIDVTHLRLISQPAPMSVCLHVKASAWQRDEIWRACVCVCAALQRDCIVWPLVSYPQQEWEETQRATLISRWRDAAVLLSKIALFFLILMRRSGSQRRKSPWIILKWHVYL